jgi:glycosyltransferase involved in cell wall biosynthesis
MPKIAMYTKALNAERTIRRAIDSVIAQTHENWVYYCCNNGSTDKAGAIIDEYAAKDSRIVALHNEINLDFSSLRQKCGQYFTLSGEIDYFASLDAGVKS